MADLTQPILDALSRFPGMSDRELTDFIRGKANPQQPINSTCRRLAKEGRMKREHRSDGIIGNYLPNDQQASPHGKDRRPTKTTWLSEDFVKAHVVAWLDQHGWDVRVAWGQSQGVDILAERAKRRWLIEAKGCGSRQPMRVNYFLSVLGELLQRMDDEEAAYAVALPDMKQFRGLWERLPRVAKTRTGISAIFVSDDGSVSFET